MENIKDKRIAIISSGYRPEITDGLVKHCLATLNKKGMHNEQVDIIPVPGALEIPLVAKKLAKKASTTPS